jgi:3-oxoacyl-[acyl-carrier-protein] synthase-3
MRYSRVHLDAIGYQLAPVVVSSDELEERLAPVYGALHIPPGQIESLTGIQERRWWERDFAVGDGAIAAGAKALETAGVSGQEVGVLVYAGVNREDFEPATACRVAAELGVRGDAGVYDISNACLGVLNGMLDIANRIELGQIRAGLVVSCETAREINDVMIERMNATPTMELFTKSLATLTGGSGAAAVLLTDGSVGTGVGHRLLGGVNVAHPEHHALCRWGLERRNGHGALPLMQTDAPSVLKHGVVLGEQTWRAFLDEVGWSGGNVDKVICHQVGHANRENILKAIGVPQERDFSTYPFLGNMGTVSLPITAALAEERGFFERGDRIGFLGIGSGLNCLMLGVEW